MSTRQFAAKVGRILLNAGTRTHMLVGAIVLIETFGQRMMAERTLFSPFIITILVIWSEGRRRNTNEGDRKRSLAMTLISVSILTSMHWAWTLIGRSVPETDTEHQLAYSIAYLGVIMAMVWSLLHNRWVQKVACQCLSIVYGLVGKGVWLYDAVMTSHEIASNIETNRAAGRCFGTVWLLAMVGILMVYIFTESETSRIGAMIIDTIHSTITAGIAIALWNEPVQEQEKPVLVQEPERMQAG